MKILFLSSWFPYPTDNGSKIRIFNLLKGLTQHHDITLLAFTRNEDFLMYLPVLQDFCCKVAIVPWREYKPNSHRALLGFFSQQPRSIVDTYSPTMHQMINTELKKGNDYDILIASQLPMAAYVPGNNRIPALFEEIELAAILDLYTKSTSIHKLRAGLTLLKTKRYISSLFTKFSAITVVSDLEKKIVSEFAPTTAPIYIIPNCLDGTLYRSVYSNPEPDTIIFTGSLTYQANYQAVCFFMNEIYPLVKQIIPSMRIKITGKIDGMSLPSEFHDESVELTGFVEDVKPLIASSAVSVVPLLGGGGTRLKILEALALGTPVVSTSKGAEGLDVQNERHLLIADNPQDFADSLIRLLKDPELRNQLGENGRRLVQEKYDWQSVMPSFLEIVESLSEPR